MVVVSDVSGFGAAGQGRADSGLSSDVQRCRSSSGAATGAAAPERRRRSAADWPAACRGQQRGQVTGKPAAQPRAAQRRRGSGGRGRRHCGGVADRHGGQVAAGQRGRPGQHVGRLRQVDRRGRRSVTGGWRRGGAARPGWCPSAFAKPCISWVAAAGLAASCCKNGIPGTSGAGAGAGAGAGCAAAAALNATAAETAPAAAIIDVVNIFRCDAWFLPFRWWHVWHALTRS